MVPVSVLASSERVESGGPKSTMTGLCSTGLKVMDNERRDAMDLSRVLCD